MQPLRTVTVECGHCNCGVQSLRNAWKDLEDCVCIAARLPSAEWREARVWFLMDVPFPVHTSTVTTLFPQPQDFLQPELLLVEGGTEAMVQLCLTGLRDTPWGQ